MFFHRPAVYEDLRQHLALTGEARILDVTMVRTGGERYAANVYLNRLHDNSGATLGYLLILEDITESKAIAEKLMRAEKLPHAAGDLGFVGRIVSVNAKALHSFVASGIVPVVAPIGFGLDGSAYNINADHAALAIARETAADALVFVTNVPGVKLDGAVVPHLAPAELEAHIASGQISGGMVPKVRSAVDAVAAGVRSVVICDLDGLRRGGGTVIS